MIRAAVLTLSDRASQGRREDSSGPAVREMLSGIDAEIVTLDVLPDEKDQIRSRMLALCESVDLIVTTGGTGLSPRDVTPDATLEVIEREIPGMAEAMRMDGLKKTPFSMLSRAVAGVRGKTLIVNLPGSTAAVRENLATILPCLPHAIEKIQGGTAECGDIMDERKIQE